VEGGPQYEVALVSESSTIKYSIDNPMLSFGQQLYQKGIDKELTLQNSGRVPFNFTVNLVPLKRKSVLQIWPLEGYLGPNEKAVFKMCITPGIPDKIYEKFYIQVLYRQNLFSFSFLAVVDPIPSYG
jgi:hydrocephalus-inducing protein